MKILCVGDLHLPFVDGNAMKKLITKARELQPDYVVQVGDLYDNYAFSKYTKSVNMLTPQQELNRGRRMAEQFWADVRAAAPQSALPADDGQSLCAYH